MTKFLTAIAQKTVCSVCKGPIYKYQEHFADSQEGYKNRERWHKKCDAERGKK